MPHSTVVAEVIATRMPEDQAGVRVVRRHHLLVRISHWLNVPILLGLILICRRLVIRRPCSQLT